MGYRETRKAMINCPWDEYDDDCLNPHVEKCCRNCPDKDKCPDACAGIEKAEEGI